VVRLVMVGLQLVGLLLVRFQLVGLVVVRLVVVGQQLVGLLVVRQQLVDRRLELTPLLRRTRQSGGHVCPVDVTPGPLLVAFDRPDDRMSRLCVVVAGVLRRGTVAAADGAAGEAHPQVDPRRTLALAAGTHAR
jgi:hypothetical protein